MKNTTIATYEEITNAHEHSTARMLISYISYFYEVYHISSTVYSMFKCCLPFFAKKAVTPCYYFEVIVR